LWKAAVDGILFRSVSASVEVHEEVLRLFLAAASHMTPTYLAHCLENTLQNTKRSRKQHKRRRIVTEYEYDPNATSQRPRAGGADVTPAGYQSPGGYVSCGTDGYSTGDSATPSGRGKVRPTLKHLPELMRMSDPRARARHSLLPPTACEQPMRSSPARRRRG
jgi:hypothetical protein